MLQEPNFSAFSNSLPPQNVDAEESILGGILLDPEAIGRVADLLVAKPSTSMTTKKSTKLP
jgi:replicative DNA helicase